MKIRIFTDGACSENPGPGGWAIAINTPNKCHTFSGNEQLTTNNRMELRAVIEAFRRVLCKKTQRPDIQYDIYSDSAYVVNTINNNWLELWKKNDWKTVRRDDVKNKDLWEKLSKLMDMAKEQNIVITINKIRGHSGNTFNELVDKLAKEESMKAKVNKE